MLRQTALVFSILVVGLVQPAMSDSNPEQRQDEPVFITFGLKDPEFSRAVQQAQASLPVFRKFLRAPGTSW